MRNTPRKWAVVFRWAVAAAGIWCAPAGRAADPYDPYTSEFERMPPEKGFTYRELQLQRMREGRDQFRKRVILPEGAEGNVRWADFARPGRQAGPKSAMAQSADEAPLGGLQDLLLGAMLVLAGIQGLRRLAPRISDTINIGFNPMRQFALAVPDLSAKVRSEEDAFAEFLKAFRVASPEPSAAPAVCAADAPNPEVSMSNDIFAVCDPLKEFFAGAPAQLAQLRRMLQELGRSQTEAVRRRVLERLSGRFRAFKGEAGRPELLPVWQMASAMEGLLKQLLAKISNATPSTLRTLASAVDLLEELCQPGGMSDLGSLSTARLLVVDDDLISRRAVAYALKRAFDHLELAEHGEEALHWAAQQTYDAVFLDVMMPGMDGFEVCSKIHATETNSATPVVFVTCQNDFDARAQSILAGGNDLIAKPFLSFEITVKALTFVLRNRLRNRGRAGGSPAAPAATETAAGPTAATEAPSCGARNVEVVREARPEMCASTNVEEKNVVRRRTFLAAALEAGAGDAVEEPRGSWSFGRPRRLAAPW